MDLVKIRRLLINECHLNNTQPILVGVSGGPDSLCLLDVLDMLGCAVIAGHMDHSLRASSAADAEFVRQFCAERHIPFTATRLDVAAYAQQAHLSIEEAARKARYRFLFDQAASMGAQAVAVAHTADDQAETLLMHLLRGAGLSGLKGMLYHNAGSEWNSPLPLVRPLLAVWRSEVLAYCAERNLNPRLDESNQDTTLFRNRLRLELLPYLESYNPRIKQVLQRTAQSLAGDYAIVTKSISDASVACMVKYRPDYVRFHLNSFKEQSTGIQRSLLRRAIADLLPSMRDVDFYAIDRGLDFISRPTVRNQVDLIKGLYLLIDGDNLFVARWGKPLLDDEWLWLNPAASVELDVPGCVEIGTGWRLNAKHLPDPNLTTQDLRDNHSSTRCWLDADTLNLPLTVRTSREGERFAPLGMEGHSLRFSDFWVNKKLPRRARATWPVVWNGNQAVWPLGFQPGHAFRITPQTKQVIELSLSHR